MAAYSSWLEQNWVNLAQTLGIVFSTLLAATAFGRETRARKLGYFLTLAQQHRELWGEAHRRPELARIFQTDADLVAIPLSVAEQEFLNLVIVHCQTGWLFSDHAAFLSRKSIFKDAGVFFSLPLPRAVWNQTKNARDPDFVQFIEAAFPPQSTVPDSE